MVSAKGVLATTAGERSAADRTYRPEIQGLRAIAVTLVFVFHLWPWLVPGGYIGVDVFFVISGYLITGGLLREAGSNGAISIRAFYVRRVRRLVPAATLVLIVVAALVPLLPVTRWENAAVEIAASAVYVENWVLAFRAVDYFAIGTAASPVQHYWSLSIEEQFYILWPLLMVATLFVARRTVLNRRKALASALAAVFVASLVASIVVAASNPDWGYFSTHTRLWELALGALLAFTDGVARPGDRARAGLGMAGALGIVVAAFAFEPETPFPGVAALLPTIGAALVIFAGTGRGLMPTAALNAPPLQYLGDRSYSLYLWHWPAIVFAVAISGKKEIDWLMGLAIVAGVIVASHLSYRFVEEPFRHRAGISTMRLPLLHAAGAVVACLLAAAVILVTIDRKPPIAIAGFDPDHPGPAALVSGAVTPKGVPFIPTLTEVRNDIPEPSRLGCHQNYEKSDPVFCSFGDPKSPVRVVLVGDSHAVQWAPALQVVAEQRGWRLITLTKTARPFAEVGVVVREKPYDACVAWRKKALKKLLKLKPDIVVTSQTRMYVLAPGPRDPKTMEQALVNVWRKLQRAGIRLIPIEDTPRFASHAPECVAAGKPDCRTLRDDSKPREDPIPKAAAAVGVSSVDMSDTICGPDWCDPIVGNVFVYRDIEHLTPTYSRMLAPYLAERAGL